jgi:hypothetical protein
VNVLVIPPHYDPTLACEAADWQVVDAARAFATRLCSAGHRDALERELSERNDQPALRRLLFARAAQKLAERPRTAEIALRAASLSFEACNDERSAVRVRLDDIALTNGTTERFADALAAANGDVPWQRELDDAVAACRDAPRVCLWLDRDQQLPAALALASRLPRTSLALAGRFARVHAATLLAQEPFRAARVIDVPVQRRIAGISSRREAPTLWWRDDGDAAIPSGSFVGAVSGDELAALAAGGIDDLRRAGSTSIAACRIAVLAFCAVTADGVVLRDGHVAGMDVLIAAARALRTRGGKLIGEWHLGAPGFDEELLAASCTRLAASSWLDGLAGLRRFGWPVDVEEGTFADLEVRLAPPAEDRDLARTRQLASPTSLASERLEALLERITNELRGRHRFAAARVAEAYVDLGAPEPPPSEPTLDPACAVVRLERALDGSSGPSYYALHARKGAIVAIDARIGQALEHLTAGAPIADALAGVPTAHRDAMLRALVRREIAIDAEAKT